jgi:hypothetical protein
MVAAIDTSSLYDYRTGRASLGAVRQLRERAQRISAERSMSTPARKEMGQEVHLSVFFFFFFICRHDSVALCV